MSYAIDLQIQPEVKPFFDPQTHTFSYVVKAPGSPACAVIDSVLDLDYAAGRTATHQADAIIAYIEQQQLSVHWIIETHVHADHLSAAPYLKARLGGQTGIGNRIRQVQHTFADVFNEDEHFARDGRQFDHLFADGETYYVGDMACFALSTPGHTPACMVHVMGNAAFVGDTLFMPDAGSARADFPGGDAGELYDSIQTILGLPDAMRLFMCHDYAPGGRDFCYETTVAEEKRSNIHVGQGQTRASFIEMREARDATLGMPQLILPSLQVNMRAGEMPIDATGRVMLKVPLNRL